MSARVEAVRQRGIRRSSDDVPALRASLDDDEPAVRAMACRALGWQRDPALADALQAAITDVDATVRQAAIKALATCFARGVRIPDDPRRALVERLGDDDADVRAAAVRICGWLGITEAAGRIRALLVGDDDGSVRAEAAHAAARLNDAAAVPALLAALDAQHGGLRHQAARALGVLSVDDAADALRARLDDPDPEVRVAALRAVVRLTDDSEPALAALSDHNAGVRCAAAILAGRHRATPIAAIEAALAPETHPEVRHHLRGALQARRRASKAG